MKIRLSHARLVLPQVALALAGFCLFLLAGCAPQVVGSHRLYFCDIAERKQFNALPAKERQKKITAVLKKQQTTNKKR